MSALFTRPNQWVSSLLTPKHNVEENNIELRGLAWYLHLIPNKLHQCVETNIWETNKEGK